MSTISRTEPDSESDEEATSLTWLKWLALLAASGYAVEKRRQHRMTDLPLIFRQLTAENDAICSLMTSVMMRSIRPSLLIGTRSSLNSLYAFVRRKQGPMPDRIREKMSVVNDGARIEIDWELPDTDNIYFSSIQRSEGVTPQQFLTSTMQSCVEDDVRRRTLSTIMRKERVLHGSIAVPVVLILHCANANSSFGYMRSVMCECTENGWVAACMNYGLSGGRSHTASYVNDLRAVVDTIALRMAPGVPLFLVGFSLGANIVVRYLGEEGRMGTLPSCIAGAVSLSNPLKVVEGNSSKPSDDASSHIFIPHVSVPLLKVVARDDPIVHQNTVASLNHCLMNPNVVVVKTKSGGHLGFHHAPWNNPFGVGDSSWADGATSKFIRALLQLRCIQSRTGDTAVAMLLHDGATREVSGKRLRSRL